jgi:hypothetical protein
MDAGKKGKLQAESGSLGALTGKDRVIEECDI